MWQLVIHLKFTQKNKKKTNIKTKHLPIDKKSKKKFKLFDSPMNYGKPEINNSECSKN